MQYVGWSDGQSALRYVESVGVFPGQLSTPQLIPDRVFTGPEKLP